MRDDWQLVANAGFGFRAPNVFDLGTLGERPGNRFNVPNANLDSENVLQGDIGLRRYSKRWRMELMLYWLRYEDRITSVLTGEITAAGRDVSRSENAARASIRGAEFSTRVALSDSATAIAMLNYTRGTQRLDSLDEPADRVPPANGRVGIEIAVNDSVGFDGWLHFAAAQERLSSRDVSDPRIDPDGTAGWASFSARLHWKAASGWHVSLGLDNVLDKRYRMHGSGIDATGYNLSLRIRNTW
jgi:outer membrane receptor protein involved in Fe transport